MLWNLMPESDRVFRIKGEVYTLMRDCPSHWIEEGMLELYETITDTGKPRQGYRVTDKGLIFFRRRAERILAERINSAHHEEELKRKQLLQRAKNDESEMISNL